VILRPGMSMTADIETETRKNVLAVPIQSVTTRAPKPEKPEGEEAQDEPMATAGNGKGKRRSDDRLKEIVFVVNGGTVKTAEVKRGISNDNYVEIVEGIGEGDEVVSGTYKAINRELEDGSKIRIEEPKGPKGRGSSERS
jgi:HlyD family secretion protein